MLPSSGSIGASKSFSMIQFWVNVDAQSRFSIQFCVDCVATALPTIQFCIDRGGFSRAAACEVEQVRARASQGQLIRPSSQPLALDLPPYEGRLAGEVSGRAR